MVIATKLNILWTFQRQYLIFDKTCCGHAVITSHEIVDLLGLTWHEFPTTTKSQVFPMRSLFGTSIDLFGKILFKLTNKATEANNIKGLLSHIWFILRHIFSFHLKIVIPLALVWFKLSNKSFKTKPNVLACAQNDHYLNTLLSVVQSPFPRRVTIRVGILLHYTNEWNKLQKQFSRKCEIDNKIWLF